MSVFFGRSWRINRPLRKRKTDALTHFRHGLIPTIAMKMQFYERHGDTGDPTLLSALHAGTEAKVRSLSAILLHEHHTG